jgi:raffinose/stachyose/melibiose transport system substrate-binding protein
VLVATGLLLLGAGEARPAGTDSVTLTMLYDSTTQAAWSVLIPNFERVYPGIDVQVNYGSVAAVMQAETTELAAGSAPSLLDVYPGCGNTIAVCVLAKAGHLAPMVKAPWVKRSIPLVTSFDKYGPSLVVFSPQVAPFGMFTNDALFRKLGLQIPQTFSQLLDVCQKAKAAGVVALDWNGANAVDISLLLQDLAVATVYGKDKHWTAEQKAGSVTFAGSAGWHQALQELVDMNASGCFEPGVSGANNAGALFAQGQSLMIATLSSTAGQINSSSPGFTYSFRALPGGTRPGQTTTLINLNGSLAVNVHTSAATQAAAQAFVSFVARPKQDALYAELTGGLTQYQFLKGQLPSFMGPLDPALAAGQYVIAPNRSWWNPDVQAALQQNGAGLLTGQTTVDGVLAAMDAAWKEGPA